MEKNLAASGAPNDPSDVFVTAAKTFLNAVGASVGPLYATGFMRVAATIKGRETLDSDDMVDIIVAMAEGIVHRGKAELEQKTMADAWQPAADAALAAKASGSLVEITQAAAKAAQDGAQATSTMKAAKGRSANLGDPVGHVDPGVASAALLLSTLAQWIQQKVS